MGEPLTGCNHFLHRNLCYLAWGLVGLLAGFGIWFAPIYVTDARAQALLEQSYMAHVEGSREEQNDVDRKLDAILRGQNQLAGDMRVVQDRLGIPIAARVAEQ